MKINATRGLAPSRPAGATKASSAPVIAASRRHRARQAHPGGKTPRGHRRPVPGLAGTASASRARRAAGVTTADQGSSCPSGMAGMPAESRAPSLRRFPRCDAEGVVRTGVTSAARPAAGAVAVGH